MISTQIANLTHQSTRRGMDSMQQQHCWVEGLVVAGLLASHSPTKATPVSPAPPIRLTPEQ